ERCFQVLREFVKHMKETSGVRFVTAQDLPQIYDAPFPPAVDSRKIAEHLTHQITFLTIEGVTLSPADMLLQLLRLEPQVVDGPTEPGLTTWSSDVIPDRLFERAEVDAA